MKLNNKLFENIPNVELAKLFVLQLYFGLGSYETKTFWRDEMLSDLQNIVVQLRNNGVIQRKLGKGVKWQLIVDPFTLTVVESVDDELLSACMEPFRTKNCGHTRRLPTKKDCKLILDKFLEINPQDDLSILPLAFKMGAEDNKEFFPRWDNFVNLDRDVKFITKDLLVYIREVKEGTELKREDGLI